MNFLKLKVRAVKFINEGYDSIKIHIIHIRVCYVDRLLGKNIFNNFGLSMFTTLTVLTVMTLLKAKNTPLYIN